MVWSDSDANLYVIKIQGNWALNACSWPVSCTVAMRNSLENGHWGGIEEAGINILVMDKIPEMKEIIQMLFMGWTVLTELVDDTAWAQAIWFYNPSVLLLNMVKIVIIFGQDKQCEKIQVFNLICKAQHERMIPDVRIPVEKNHTWHLYHFRSSFPVAMPVSFYDYSRGQWM